ncbi:nucleotidyltransferase family protein [Sphaerisporangium aureirubrum]|uniref:NTP transferase domain-containing protein n=1 Tax=Sphaerisporangium aureirubrum TaxID=1544736 RepID=A0ABW1NQL3_9ACTN
MTDPGVPAGLLLAAGAGTRFGAPKAVVELAGERLADRGVRLLRDGGCDPVVVVLGAATVPLPGALVVRNPDWESGMGSSLRAGLAGLPPSAGAVVIALADQPLIGAEAVRRLVAAWRDGATAAVATYGGAPRNPVLLAREHFAEAGALAVGDVGARAFLRARRGLVTRVPCDDVGDPADIDTLADLARIAPAVPQAPPAPPSR